MYSELKDGLPQLLNALPHELFRDDEEYHGAMKFLGYFIHRMGKADSDLIWKYLGSVSEKPDGEFDFRYHVANLI